MRIINRISSALVLALLIMPYFTYAQESNNLKFWKIQSIDTMKYSRDTARDKIADTAFEKIIDNQIKKIADTGATHVSIGTPYDEEFIPFLKKWVAAARKYGLKVWFRGNWSGWEGWFGYSRITEAEHINKTKAFISGHPELFQDGDIFTACPECENGGPGDPRMTRKLNEFREFLISEHQMMDESFKKINKKVTFNYNSMNGDVAYLVMDRATTQALGGVITIDHYVKTKERLISDIRKLSEQGGGARIVLGEFGAPIPDIHGNMSEVDQAKWIEDAMTNLAVEDRVEGINYWTNIGGSTEIWSSKLVAKPAVQVITDFYKPKKITGYAKNEFNQPVSDAIVSNQYAFTVTDKNGYFSLPYLDFINTNLRVERNNFNTFNQEIKNYDGNPLEIKLTLSRPNFKLFVIKTISDFARTIVSFFHPKEIEIYGKDY